MLTNESASALYADYVEGWKPVSDTERTTIANRVIAPSATYATPNHASGNRATIVADMVAFQAKFPGGHFDVGDVSAHHDVALLTWILVKADGTEVARGHDQIRVANDQIVDLITFAPSKLRDER